MHYAFRSYIKIFNPFSVYFLYVLENGHFILLYVVVQFSQHHLLKRLSSPVVNSWLLCSKLTDQKSVGLFLDSAFCSADLFVFVAVPYYFDYCSFVVQLEIRSMIFIPSLFFCLKIALAIWRLL